MLRIIFICLLNLLFAVDRNVEEIHFISANPFSFYDVITDLDNQEPQDVFGVLTIPEHNDTSIIFPLVIGVAGSLGWGEHHYKYLEMYQEMGIATFELNSFKSRNVESTVGTQIDCTHAMMILDAYKALDSISNHPKIDKNKIAITGWSLGGGVALFSGWDPLRNAIGSNEKFAAHLSFYPPCIVDPEVLKFTDSPMHILAGELDNWVPADACVDLVNKMIEMGTDIDVTVYDDAHHSFDRKQAVEVSENAYILEDCRFKMNGEGAVLMNFLKIPMTTPFRQKVALACCAKRGPTFGGNPEAREQSFLFAREFMHAHLIDNE